MEDDGIRKPCFRALQHSTIFTRGTNQKNNKKLEESCTIRLLYPKEMVFVPGWVPRLRLKC